MRFFFPIFSISLYFINAFPMVENSTIPPATIQLKSVDDHPMGSTRNSPLWPGQKFSLAAASKGPTPAVSVVLCTYILLCVLNSSTLIFVIFPCRPTFPSSAVTPAPHSATRSDCSSRHRSPRVTPTCFPSSFDLVPMAR